MPCRHALTCSRGTRIPALKPRAVPRHTSLRCFPLPDPLARLAEKHRPLIAVAERVSISKKDELLLTKNKPCKPFCQPLTSCLRFHDSARSRPSRTASPSFFTLSTVRTDTHTTHTTPYPCCCCAVASTLAIPAILFLGQRVRPLINFIALSSRGGVEHERYLPY